MPGPLRIKYKNAFYHASARGGCRAAIFICPAVKEKVLIKPGATAEK
jgi:hypothetical protein